MNGSKLSVYGSLGAFVLQLLFPINAFAQEAIATTTLTISICGDAIVNAGEQCDIPGETGVYSTTIAGRQCSTQCLYGPYCGDAILQTVYDEECDDGNNTSGDFCAADCTVEATAGGGGSASGGGGGSSGGSNDPMGDTQVNITGKAFPNSTVNIIEDGDVIGTVRANSSGDFTFATDVEPGTTSYGFWSRDADGNRSITLNTTFDVTQGAVTNVNGIFIPPTLVLSESSIPQGGTITFSGRTVPNVDVKAYIDGETRTQSVRSDTAGRWTMPFVATGLSQGSHTVKPRFEFLQGGKLTESNFGQAVTFYIGTPPPGGAISSSDLNRDGKVNLIDFSILIFWWGGAGGDSDPPADINGNGKVGLEDFSILLFNWTG